MLGVSYAVAIPAPDPLRDFCRFCVFVQCTSFRGLRWWRFLRTSRSSPYERELAQHADARIHDPRTAHSRRNACPGVCSAQRSNLCCVMERAIASGPSTIAGFSLRRFPASCRRSPRSPENSWTPLPRTKRPRCAGGRSHAFLFRTCLSTRSSATRSACRRPEVTTCGETFAPIPFRNRLGGANSGRTSTSELRRRIKCQQQHDSSRHLR